MRRLTFCLALLTLLIAGTVGAYRIIEVPEVGARTITMVMGGVAEVASNGYVGNENISGGAFNKSAVIGRAYYSDIVATTSGTVSYAHLYITASDQNESICLCLHETDGTVKACTSSGDISVASGWLNWPLTSSTTISSGTTYHLSYVMGDTDDFSAASGAYGAAPPDDVYYIDSISCGNNGVTGGTLSGNRPIAIVFDNQSGDP